MRINRFIVTITSKTVPNYPVWRYDSLSHGWAKISSLVAQEAMPELIHGLLYFQYLEGIGVHGSYEIVSLAPFCLLFLNLVRKFFPKPRIWTDLVHFWINCRAIYCMILNLLYFRDLLQPERKETFENYAVFGPVRPGPSVYGFRVS